LIFEYLPHKEQQMKHTSIKEEKSVIDMLLGRLPIWPSSPSPPLSTSPLNDAGMELLNLLQQQPKEESSDSTDIEQNRAPISIVDRLNEAIRQATCNENHNSPNNTNHRIAVQA
jgi:hypothetical protein